MQNSGKDASGRGRKKSLTAERPRGGDIGMATRSVNLNQHRNFISDNLHRFANMKLLVIGDVGVDEYVTGDVRRISPEAPVPVLEVNGEHTWVGLSGNVAQNIASLGGTPHLISVIGADDSAARLRELLRKNGVSDDGLIVDETRPTTRKLRVMAQHHHIVRVDYEQRRYLSPEIEEKLLLKVQAALSECAGVILQDYAKGVLGQKVIQKIIELAHQKQKKVLLDPYRSTPLNYYRGVDLMTPNYDESLALAGFTSDDFADPEDLLKQIGRKLMQTTGSAQLVITLGKRGMRLVENEAEVHMPTYARQVFDVTGAGDTVIAMLGLAWLSGFSLEQACVAANFAAGVVVGKVGCVPCTLGELKEYMSRA